MQKKLSDFVIVGGGVIGVSLAKALSQRFPDAAITIYEKEKEVGLHTSGRNSGVLHAGFYYSTNSLKAKFSRDGCREWTEFCEEHDVPILKCGKIVASTRVTDAPYL